MAVVTEPAPGRARTRRAIVDADIHVTLAAPDALDHRRYPELVEQMAEAVDVGEPRQISESQLVFGEQCAGQQGQRRILGARDRDLSLEALAALDPDAVHRRALAGWHGL